jgi:hypothetical protein
MKIRLHGTVAECREMTELLEQVMVVQAASDPYPDRGRSVLVRVYVEGIPSTPADAVTVSAAHYDLAVRALADAEILHRTSGDPDQAEEYARAAGQLADRSRT